MGPRLKLPRYVHAFTDRHGRARFYFRRAGFDRKPLRGLLGDLIPLRIEHVRGGIGGGHRLERAGPHVQDDAHHPR